MTEYLWVAIYDYVVCISIWFYSCLASCMVNLLCLFYKVCFVYVLNYVCFTHFGLFDVAKWGEKMGILEIKIIFSSFSMYRHKHWRHHPHQSVSPLPLARLSPPHPVSPLPLARLSPRQLSMMSRHW